MKLTGWLLAAVLLASPAWAQDSKVTDLDALASPSTDDLLYVVDDPAGVATSKKATISAVVGAANAATATALAANGANCSAGSFPLGVDASGAAESCTDAATQTELDAHINDATAAHAASAISVDSTNLDGVGTDAQTVLEELETQIDGKLSLSGGTMTGQLVTDNLGIEFPPSDTNPTCGAGNYNIYTDLSDGKLKKCQDGVVTDLDTFDSTGVTAAAPFGTDLSCLVSDGTSRGAQSRGTACTIDGSGNMVLEGNLTVSSGGSGPSVVGMVEGTAPGAGASAGVHNLYFNSTDSALYSHENGGSAVKYANTSTTTVVKSAYASAAALYGDGTQCPAAPSTVTINSGAPRSTFICADNDGSTLYGEFAMPDGYDGGTVTLMGLFVQTAADTANLNADVAMACRGDGVTINNTWGTEVAMDTAMTGSNALDTVTTAAITPNGTCTGGGKLLQFRWQMDASGTTTAVATLHVLGFKLEYTTVLTD